jgi:hypothetical protein
LHRAIAGVCRQLSNADLKFSNAEVHVSARASTCLTYTELSLLVYTSLAYLVDYSGWLNLVEGTSPGLLPYLCAHSGHLTGVLSEIRRFWSGFSKVDSVFPQKESDGCVHGVRTRLCFFNGKQSRPRKTPTPNVAFGGYLGDRR